jgi:hypothetical protein
MVIVHSYVKLPEGKSNEYPWNLRIVLDIPFFYQQDWWFPGIFMGSNGMYHQPPNNVGHLAGLLETKKNWGFEHGDWMEYIDNYS